MRFLATLLACLLGVAALPAAAADFNGLLGTWENEDAGSRGIVKVVVGGSAAGPTLQVFGACSPTPCDWGVSAATAYSSSTGSSPAADTQAVVASFAGGGGTTLVVLRPRGDRVEVTAYKSFTDGSGRNGYVTEGRFRKAAAVSGLGAEDCIAFRTDRVQVQQSGGRSRITDGSSILMDFGSNNLGAVQAVVVLLTYGMNQQCFVGRPDQSVSYYLKSGQAPAGELPGEDCIAFNPANLQAQQAQGRWKVVEGSHWLLDFGNRQDYAQRMVQVLRHHGFTRICYVGRPNPPMTYFRK